MAGNASTTMFVFSRLSRGVPPPDPPEEHPAASIVTATADAMSTLRGFITAPSGIAASPATPRSAGWVAPRSAAASNHVTEHLKVPYRPSHAKRYDLSESSATLLALLTQCGRPGVRSRRRVSVCPSSCDMRHFNSERFWRFLAVAPDSGGG